MYFNWVISPPVRTRRYAETWSDTESQPTGCGPEPARASTRAPVGLILALLQTPKAGGGAERGGHGPRDSARGAGCFLRFFVCFFPRPRTS